VPRVRLLSSWDAGVESAIDGYRTDQVMAAAVASDPDTALLRVWTRPSPAMSVGRYHRIVEGRHADMQRRLSGGRVVPVGPDLLGVTLAVGSSEWLSATVRLRPEQVLNRALRPVLAVLRSFGVDAFYGGRDLVTVGGRPLLYASFCPFADGAFLIEQILAVSSSFAQLEGLAGRLDPEGSTVAAPAVFTSATALAALGVPLARSALLSQLSRAAQGEFGAETCVLEGPPDDLAHAVAADEETYACFARERGACPPNAVTAATVGMLGLVEAAAILENGTVRNLEICGDVIAPFETLEALALACVTQRAAGDVLRRAVLRELAAPGRFVLGLLDIEELVGRLV
jgi:hypothetical protein